MLSPFYLYFVFYIILPVLTSA